MKHATARAFGLALLLLSGGCARPLRIAAFADQGPAFDPLRFFTGHVRSWGVIENRSGQPTGWVATDCVGEAEGGDGLRMVQRLIREDGSTRTRVWRMRRTGPHRYEATANDMVGQAVGEAEGRAFHWRWTLAAEPGNALKNVMMEQWMFLLDDGAVLNRTVVSKFGVMLAQISEQFARAP